MSDLELLQRLNAAGCSLLISVPGIHGDISKIATPEQALRLLGPEGRDAIFAELVGLSRPQYVEWRESQGSVYCSADTLKGKRCTHFAIGGTNLSPEAWLALFTHGGYCRTHGG